MKVAYIICSCLYQLVTLAGGAALFWLGGSWLWLATGILLSLGAGTSLNKRMKQWRR